MRGALEEAVIREFWNVKVGKVFSSGNGFPLMNQLHSAGSNSLEHLDENNTETESRLGVVKKRHGQLLMSAWAWEKGTKRYRTYGCLPVLILPSHFTDSINEAQS